MCAGGVAGKEMAMGAKPLVVLLLAGVVALAAVGTVWAQEESPLLLAELSELAQYPQIVSLGQTPLDQRLFVLVLPEVERAVVLRPMTAEEFGGFQVQALPIELIEYEMLATVLVLPVLAPEDVPGLPEALVTALKRAVNQISGFAVFAGVVP
jgi:hypothetical protein